MIKFKNLTNTPKDALRNTHYYCDYIELLCLCDIDGELSVGDIYDRYFEDDKIKQVESEGFNGAEADKSKTIDSWNTKIAAWFGELMSRQQAYAQDYPFIIEQQKITLKNELAKKQQMYLGLLLCSSLSYLQSSDTFTCAFEFMTFCALKRYLPQQAEVRIFGVSSKNSANTYQGSLEAKIRSFAQDINEVVSTRANIFNKYDSGDGGADIVAWLPFKKDDNLEHKLVILGQSAAGKNWKDKQASVNRLTKMINFYKPPLNLLCVPYDMRNAEREYTENSNITVDIVFDRHRMLGLLEPDEVFSADIGARLASKISAAIDYSESIV